jgi:hypothetical protein
MIIGKCMIKKNKNTIIIFWPGKFLENHYLRYELEYLKQYCSVIIVEFGEYLNKYFYDSLYESQSCRSMGVVKINRAAEIFQLLKNTDENTIVVNYLPNDSWRIAFINIIIRISRVKTLLVINNSSTLYATERKWSEYNYSSLLNPKKTLNFIMRLFYKQFVKSGDYTMSVGNSIQIKDKGKKFYVGSWEYSNSLLNDNNVDIDYKYAVLLDGAGPKFNDDRNQTNKMEKVYPITSDEWYPSLINFMEKLEGIHNLRFVIAAHPKSNFNDDSEEFGGRSIYYGKAQELVRNSELVVTRGSTATIFCVTYNKPVFFIYNNQMLLSSGQNLRKCNEWNKDIGGKVVNIDNYSVNLLYDISTDIYKYQSYIDKIIAINNPARPNWQIMLHNLFGYSYDEFNE